MKIVIIVVLIFICYQIFELNRFTIRQITLSDDKIKHGGHFVFLTDLHGHSYGRNSRLVQAVKKIKPEAIILGGDVISKQHWEQCVPMTRVILELQKIAPVYYILGNHETKMELDDPWQFDKFITNLIDNDVQVIRNGNFRPFMDSSISCYGLELPLSLYAKRVDHEFPESLLESIKEEWEDDGSLRILISHQPAFADDYAKLRLDGIFSGHTHGGLVRIPGFGSVICPELKWWPKYDAGCYRIGEDKKTVLVVSQGLGTHHIHLRVFDPAQLLDVYLTPTQKADESLLHN